MPKDKKSAMEEFLGDIPVAGQQKQTEDVFDKPLDGKEVIDPEKGGDTEPEPRKNRHHRRLEAKYQAEREVNIGLAARLEAMSEAQKFIKDTNASNVDENLIRLYGNDEKGLLAAKITQDLLNKTKVEARQEALDAFTKQQEDAAQEVAAHRSELDEMLEEVEDEFNVDLTSDEPTAIKARQGFYKMLEKVSPKNKEGVVTDYADPLATWEFYQQQNKSTDTNRAKDLGSRSMVKSGSSGDSNLEASAQERFLKEAGII